MGVEPVEPDWPPLSVDEVGDVLGELWAPSAPTSVELTWLSPRPFAASAGVEIGSDRRELVVKRHHRAVRDTATLESEHCYLQHLAGTVPVPVPLGIVERADWCYEILAAVAGEDLYRDDLSWTPYRSAAHARSAGASLAVLHLATAGFEAPGRPFVPLMCSSGLVTAEDLLAAIGALASARPGLGSYLARRPWRSELSDHLAGWHARLRPVLPRLVPSWSHGDWHPSNLLWSSGATDESGEIAGVIDFGLSNRTSTLHDIATAIERAAVNWLDPPGRRRGELAQVESLLAGYRSVRELAPADLEALARLLPLVHVEYALSEVEYFHDVVGSPTRSDLAYEGYLLGHADFFAGAAGAELLELVAAEG